MFVIEYIFAIGRNVKSRFKNTQWIFMDKMVHSFHLAQMFGFYFQKKNVNTRETSLFSCKTNIWLTENVAHEEHSITYHFDVKTLISALKSCVQTNSNQIA